MPAGEWIWANGSSVDGPNNVTGVYGTPGIASPSNTPPGAQLGTTWTDRAGNLWLFGGQIEFTSDGLGEDVELNDLWMFDPLTAEWTWVSGAGSNVPVAGTYGQIGVAALTNAPGGRVGASGWVDASGNLWLFGGRGYDSNGNLIFLNDLWMFNPLSSEWTWMGGDNSIGGNTGGCSPANYGALGVSAASNTPGGRDFTGAWVDGAGTFWLFGGMGCVDDQTRGLLDDLWSYTPSSGQWTWVGGSDTVFASGIYGMQGVASDSSQPGSRYTPANWSDGDGKLWMFGGEGMDSTSALGFLNDLWRFDPSTRQWTWISGSKTIGDENCDLSGTNCARSSVYGTLNEPAPANVPGGRTDVIGAQVANGDFLLFDGLNAGEGLTTYFDDLWQFNRASGEWAWIDGSDLIVCGSNEGGNCTNGEIGVYGTQGTTAAADHPGSRASQVGWVDRASNLWMFGGVGFDSQGLAQHLNDIWEYQVAPSLIPPKIDVTASANPVFTQNAFTLTAHVTTATTLNLPTGTVQFLRSDSTTGSPSVFGSATVDASGNATLPVVSFPVGTFRITAAYNGDAKTLAATGSTTEAVGDFTLAANAPTSVTVASGGAATFNLALSPLGPITMFPAAISLTASGGPADATYVFAPASVASGSSATNVTLTVTTPASPVARGSQWPSAPGGAIFLVAVLVPFFRWSTRARRPRPMYREWSVVLLLLIAGPGAALALGGCCNSFYTRASGPGSPIPPVPPTPPSAPHTYNITITGASGALSHSVLVTLVVD